ncbi:MAG TPA: sigma-70 family RNA polymerase sigma factor [Verrucomicrobiae bacterium]|nr:sigma-70 family RNA polymerase sigma factor [Verrucomicrobiae bacterium]
MADDLELLREFTASGAEEAFRALVERHSGMVHGVALRVAGDALADEVTQAVFIILARKAGTLRDGAVVGAWLYRTARFVALEAARAEKRRRARNEAFCMSSDESEKVWSELAPVLDEAVGRLGEAERSAVVLRFFEGQTFSEVATELGISEAAAKMRVGRAIEKLRTILAREGVVTSASALGASLTTHAASTAPVAVTKALMAAVVGKEASGPMMILANGGLKAMAAAKTKSMALAVAALFLLCGGMYGVYEVARPKPVMASFVPMAGEWEGKLELKADDMPGVPVRAARLNVKTSPDGRTCDIDMRILPNEVDEQRFHFRHVVDDSGRSITTTDDPMIGLLNGAGDVTVARTNSTGFWKAGFKAQHRTGRSDCEWTVNGSELKIVRRDVLAINGQKVNRSSIVDLHRKLD